ncbi:MAG TPA: hypothetical protein VK272_04920 [Solirubrobacteraceae bacterium]|nr:hypothetical protein [Solirubrobacteraceae bacterium]
MSITPSPAPRRPGLRPHRRAQAWLWTGPIGHLLGGTLDFASALARYQLARARRRLAR